MTRDEILNMPAGREMDALVAEKVLGLQPCDAWEMFHWSMSGGEYIHHPERCIHGNKCYPVDFCPEYSNNIYSAWKVMEKIIEYGPAIRWDIEENYWYCTLWYSSDPNDVLCEGQADTASLAICRAALLAMMEVE